MISLHVFMGKVDERMQKNEEGDIEADGKDSDPEDEEPSLADSDVSDDEVDTALPPSCYAPPPTEESSSETVSDKKRKIYTKSGLKDKDAKIPRIILERIKVGKQVIPKNKLPKESVEQNQESFDITKTRCGRTTKNPIWMENFTK